MIIIKIDVYLPPNTCAMKQKLIILTAILFLSVNVFSQKTGETKVLRPTKFRQEVSIVVSNKSRIYYQLSPERESLVFVQGPGKLRVLTRAQFLPGFGRTLSYGINYSLNGGEITTLKVKSTERSAQVSFADNQPGIPGQLHQFEILIPRGDNTISFWLTDNKAPVCVRYLFNPVKEKKKEWIPFAPIQSMEVVDLVSHESVVTYYRFSNEQPLRINVIGPTQLRVFTRVEFSYQMRGSVNYRLQVLNNGKVINTYQMNNKRSDVATYKNNSELVPGKASEFVIDVPAGNQTYEILPLDKDKNSILARTMIIKKDVRNSSQ